MILKTVQNCNFTQIKYNVTLLAELFVHFLHMNGTFLVSNFSCVLLLPSFPCQYFHCDFSGCHWAKINNFLFFRVSLKMSSVSTTITSTTTAITKSQEQVLIQSTSPSPCCALILSPHFNETHGGVIPRQRKENEWESASRTLVWVVFRSGMYLFENVCHSLLLCDVVAKCSKVA